VVGQAPGNNVATMGRRISLHVVALEAEDGGEPPTIEGAGFVDVWASDLT
jgi:hypothetical protein